MRIWSPSESSGHPATPVPSCCAWPPSIPTSTWSTRPATRRRAPPRRRCIRRSPARIPRLVFESFDVERARGLDLVFLGLPHEASMALAPELVGHVGCVVDLSAAYRLKDRAQYPAYYGFEHDQPELLADAVYGLPGEVPQRAQGGRTRRHARVLRDRRDVGARAARRGRGDRDERRDRRCRERRVGRRAQAQPREPVRHGRRQLHGVRVAEPPSHPRDGAGDRRPDPVHAAPGADEPRHPRHVLRASGGRFGADDRVVARHLPAAASRASRSSSSPRSRRRRRRRSDRTRCT